MSSLMNIGEAAKASGISAKMIRHYESVGLFPLAARTHAGYRQYSEKEISTLRFIRHARDLGFSIAQIFDLLGLWQNRARASSSVKRIAQKHLDELNARIAAMQAMQRTLSELLDCCHGDGRPECPILDDLAGKQ